LNLFLSLLLFLPLSRQAHPSALHEQKPPKKEVKSLRPSQVPAILRYSRIQAIPFQKRISLLKKAISSSLMPGFPKVSRLLLQTQLGMLLLATRNPGQALQTFEKVLKAVNPNQTDLLGRSLLGKGQALFALGKKKLALRVLRSVELRCPGTVYAKQSQKTATILKNLSSHLPLSSLPKFPLRIHDLEGKVHQPKKARFVLYLKKSLSRYVSTQEGARLARKLKDPGLLALVFAEDPKSFPSPLKHQIRKFEEQTGLGIFFLSPEINKVLLRLFPLQSPKSILFTLNGRFLDLNPSPNRCAAFVAAG